MKARNNETKRLPILLICACFVISSCTSKKTNQLTIAVAANMQFAMPELVHAFEQNTGIKAIWVVSSSGKITAQVKAGAYFDVFVSADLKYPLDLYNSNFTSNVPKVYANGQLILWSLSDEVDLKMDALNTEKIKHVAIANPTLAPYGLAAVQALRYAEVYENIKTKLVFGESIAQTNQFITTQAAQIGITAKSVIMAPTLQNKGHWVDIDPQAYSPIEQAVVVLKSDDKHRDDALKFFDFLFSDVAKEILDKFGYSVPE